MDDNVEKSDLLACGQKPDRKRTRRTNEESAALARAKAERRIARETKHAEKVARKAARAADLARISAEAKSLAKSFERRADTLAKRAVKVSTSSARKGLRKMLRAAAEADNRQEREIRRIAEEGGEVRDRGTGLTRMKLGTPPLGLLMEKKKIGAEERNAADDISTAFSAIASRVSIRGMTFDRVDKSGGDDPRWPTSTVHAVARYTKWANHWSARANAYCDPTLEIVIAAVIDERPFRIIAADLGYHHTRVERAVILGLRDYAARAGMVPNRMGDAWIASAESLFVPYSARLMDAMRRARIET